VRAQDHAFSGADAAHFLRHLVGHLAIKLLVLWDGRPIHHSQEVKAFLASPAGKALPLERLPGYAPDLNLDEGGWQLLKGGALKNVTCTQLGQLFGAFWKPVKRLRQKPWLLRACFAEPGLV
jgi:transposase